MTNRNRLDSAKYLSFKQRDIYRVDSIPVLDLKQQYNEVGSELERRVLDVLRSGNYILGQNVALIEDSVARLCGCRYGIGVANGTDALVLALMACEIGAGDEVITSPFTFAASAEAIALRGAKIVFVDIDKNTFNINPELIESAITGKTKAILPVHLYGQPADMERIGLIARGHGLKVIEDNAQALGALFNGKPTGSMSDVAAVSFYPTKNLGACGDAGMLVTNNPAIAERLRALRTHGSYKRYYHDEVGVNSRLDELQAAILLSKINYLSAWNEKRCALADCYCLHLKDCPGVILPTVARGMLPVWHQYTIRIKNDHAGLTKARDFLKLELAARGISTMCYYPLPLHLQPALANLGYVHGDFPVAEVAADEVLSLPMYPELTVEQVAYIAEAIRQIMAYSDRLSLPGNVVQQGVLMHPQMK